MPENASKQTSGNTNVSVKSVNVKSERRPVQLQRCVTAPMPEPLGHSPVLASLLSCSGRPHAHLQRSRGDRHHRFWHPGSRSDAGQAAAQRGLLRHPQPPRARQDGGRVQSLRKHVWTHARHVPRNIRCDTFVFYLSVC